MECSPCMCLQWTLLWMWNSLFLSLSLILSLSFSHSVSVEWKRSESTRHNRSKLHGFRIFLEILQNWIARILWTIYFVFAYVLGHLRNYFRRFFLLNFSVFLRFISFLPLSRVFFGFFCFLYFNRCFTEFFFSIFLCVLSIGCDFFYVYIFSDTFCQVFKMIYWFCWFSKKNCFFFGSKSHVLKSIFFVLIWNRKKLVVLYFSQGESILKYWKASDTYRKCKNNYIINNDKIVVNLVFFRPVFCKFPFFFLFPIDFFISRSFWNAFQFIPQFILIWIIQI